MTNYCRTGYFLICDWNGCDHMVEIQWRWKLGNKSATICIDYDGINIAVQCLHQRPEQRDLVFTIAMFISECVLSPVGLISSNTDLYRNIANVLLNVFSDGLRGFQF